MAWWGGCGHVDSGGRGASGDGICVDGGGASYCCCCCRRMNETTTMTKMSSWMRRLLGWDRSILPPSSSLEREYLYGRIFSAQQRIV
jgi:hypothetical protein